jgi:hypothetical protein
MKDPWLFLLGTFYLLSCFLPEVKGVSPPGIAYLINPFALIVPAWWANPLFFAGFVALAKGKIGLASGLGVVATVLASTFFIMSFEKFGFSSLKVPCFDCWLISMVGLAASGFVVREGTREPDEPEKPHRIDDV